MIKLDTVWDMSLSLRTVTKNVTDGQGFFKFQCITQCTYHSQQEDARERK